MKITDEMIKAALEAWFGEPVTEPYEEHADNMRFAIQAAMQAAWIDIEKMKPAPRQIVMNSNNTLGYWEDSKWKGVEGFVIKECAQYWLPLPEFKE